MVVTFRSLRSLSALSLLASGTLCVITTGCGDDGSTAPPGSSVGLSVGDDGTGGPMVDETETNGDTGGASGNADTGNEPVIPSCEDGFDENGACLCNGEADCNSRCELESCNIDCQSTSTCQVGCGDAATCASECWDSATCSFDCEQSDVCQPTCSGSGVCTMACSDAQSCEISCIDSAECQTSCANATSCTSVCEHSAICTTACEDAATCELDCRDSAQCDVTCKEGQSCGLKCEYWAMCRCTGSGCTLECDPDTGGPVTCGAPNEGFVACDIAHCDGDPYN